MSLSFLPAGLGGRLNWHGRLVAMLAVLAACWPVLRWYGLRLIDGSDEPWGVVALFAAVVVNPPVQLNAPMSSARWAALTLLLVVYALSFPWVPPLGRALVLVTAVAVVMGGKTFPLAWWTLLALSLPLVATLQFYLGYPLRLATTALCPWLLKLGGWTVLAQGTTLRWAGETVVVDAPCSGIQMLWTGCFLAAVLACHEKLNTHETWRLFQRTSLSIFVANVVRASVIFCLEAGLWHGPAWAHEGVGLALFAVAAVTILLHSRRLARAQAENIAGADLSPIEQPRASS